MYVIVALVFLMMKVFIEGLWIAMIPDTDLGILVIGRVLPEALLAVDGHLSHLPHIALIIMQESIP